MTNISLNTKEIFEYLPQKPPFLLIDRILSLTPHEFAVAIKNVTINEPFFAGHFPDNPVMPGVLILEALGQTSTVLAFASKDDNIDDGTLYYLAGINNARFKRVVEPGDQLRLEVRVKKIKRSLWIIQSEATVDGELACSAELMSIRKEGNKE